MASDIRVEEIKRFPASFRMLIYLRETLIAVNRADAERIEVEKV